MHIKRTGIGILIPNKVEFKATKYKREKGGCFMIRATIHQEGIKIPKPPSTHIFYFYAPNNMGLKIKKKQKQTQKQKI